jgi:Tfp pilus assembly PilM family ATPase
MSNSIVHAGFTLTSVKLQAVEVVAKHNRFNISAIDEAYFNEEIDFISDKETKISAMLLAAYEELCIKNSITSSSISFSLPQELFTSAILPVEHSLLHSDLIEEFRWRLSIIYPFYNWNDYVLRYYETYGVSHDTGDSALVFALNRKYIKIVNNFCTKINVKLKFIDHCHLASNNLLMLNSEKGGNTQLSLFLTQKIFSVLITTNGKPIFYEDIPISNFHEITGLIKEKIVGLKNDSFNFTDATLFGDSSSYTIAKVLTELTGINFGLVNPFTHFTAEENLLTTKYFTETNHFFAPSAGTAVRI